MALMIPLFLLLLCLPPSAADPPHCVPILRLLRHLYYAANTTTALHSLSTNCSHCSLPPPPPSLRLCPAAPYYDGCSQPSAAHIRCSAAGALTELRIGGWNLSGELSQFLHEVVMNDSRSGGGGTLAGLRHLDLSRNSFNGSMPTLLWSMPDLTHLNLSSNSLHGAVSMTLAPCSNGGCRNGGGGETYPLQVMDVSYNGGIRGEVPDGFCARFPNLTVIRLSHNRITAANLSDCQRLATLDASFNRLQGPMLDSLAPSISGGTIDLSHNQINDTGTSVKAFINRSCIAGTISLDLSFNRLSGPLSLPIAAADPTPPEFIVQLNVSHNRLHLVNLTLSFVSRFGISAFLPNMGCDGWCRNSGGAATAEAQLARAPATPPPSPPSSGNGINNERNFHSHSDHHIRRHNFVIIVAASAAAAAAAVIGLSASTMIFLCWRRRRRTNLSKAYVDPSVAFHDNSSKGGVSSQHLKLASFSVKDPTAAPVVFFQKPLLRLTFADILRATAYFGSAATQLTDDLDGNQIYTCMLPGVVQEEDNAGCRVAIKVLGGGDSGIRRMPAAEAAAMFTAMSDLKHENLVPLLGYCIVGEDKLLIYKHVEREMRWEDLLGDEAEEMAVTPILEAPPDDFWRETDQEVETGAGRVTESEKKKRRKKKKLRRIGWEGRVKIGLGVARAVAYLHARQAVHGALHGGCVVVELGTDAGGGGDGGADKLAAPSVDGGETAAGPLEVAAARVVYQAAASGGGGGGRYVAPECWGGSATRLWEGGRLVARAGDASGHVCTGKCDMYGVGVILMEMVAGVRAVGDVFTLPLGATSVVGWVRHLMKDVGHHHLRGQSQDSCEDGSGSSGSSSAAASAVIDPSLPTYVRTPALRLLHMAYLCTAESPSKRPSAQQVVGLLKELST